MINNHPRHDRFDELSAGRDLAHGLKSVRVAQDALLDALRHAKADAAKSRFNQASDQKATVAALSAELTELRRRLANKEAHAVKRLTELVKGLLATVDDVALRFRTPIIEARVRYEKMAQDDTFSVADATHLRRTIGSLRNALEKALIDELHPLADKIIIALNNAAPAVIKQLTPLVRELDERAAPDLIPNDVAIRKIVEGALRHIQRDVSALEQIEHTTYTLTVALLAQRKREEIDAEYTPPAPQATTSEIADEPHEAAVPVVTADEREDDFVAELFEPQITPPVMATTDPFSQALAAPETDAEVEVDAAPDFISPPGAQAAAEKQAVMAKEIAQLKAALQRELKTFHEMGVERENRWQIFMDNEQARHADQLKQIRAEFASQIKNEAKAQKVDQAAAFAAKLAAKQEELRATVDAARTELAALSAKKAAPATPPVQPWRPEDDAIVAAKRQEINALFDSLQTARRERDSLEAHQAAAFASGSDRERLANELAELAQINDERIAQITQEDAAADARVAAAEAKIADFNAQRAELEAALRAAAGRIDAEVVSEQVADRLTARFQHEIDRLREENTNLLQYLQQLQPAPDPFLTYDPFAGAWANPPGFVPEDGTVPVEQTAAAVADTPPVVEEQAVTPLPAPAPSPEQSVVNEHTINVVVQSPPVSEAAEKPPAESDENVITTRRARFVRTGEERVGRLSSEEIRRYANALIAANRPEPKVQTNQPQ